MKMKTNALKKGFLARLVCIIAMAAAIGFSMTACEEEDKYGTVPGTYYLDQESTLSMELISFSDNGTYANFETSGTYTVSGSSVKLSRNWKNYGTSWTIVDKTTLKSEDGSTWIKE